MDSWYGELVEFAGCGELGGAMDMVLHPSKGGDVPTTVSLGGS